MRRATWRWARVAGGGATLGVLVWRLGTGPFLDGLRTVDARALAASCALVALSTVCSAWRWRIIARGLGVEVSLPAAVAAYYRAIFLNVVLPGGVAGDVHRGVRHGRNVSDVGRALRSVAWERLVGQLVQVALTLVVLLALPSPLHAVMPLVAVVVVTAVIVIVFLARTRAGGTRTPWGRLRGAIAGDLRDGLLARRAWLGVVVASAVVVCGHVVTFVVAARAAGTAAPLPEMLPIALLVITAMVLPNVAGWGPREGVAAWAFATAGLGAHRGIAASVAYGVMVFVASLPGALVLLGAWVRRPGPARRPARRAREGAAHA